MYNFTLAFIQFPHHFVLWAAASSIYTHHTVSTQLFPNYNALASGLLVVGEKTNTLVV